MNRSVACLRSYVAAWWMKLIAVAIAIVAANAVLFLSPTEILEPAWPRPALVHWQDIERQAVAVPLSDIRGLSVDTGFFDMPAERIRSLVRRLPSLRYCRVTAPSDVGKGPHAASVNEAITTLFEELFAATLVDSLEFTGITPVAVLSQIRSSENIRHLYTSDQYWPDPSGGENRLATLVDVVVSLPRLLTWGLSKESARYISELDLERTGALREHPMLNTVLLPQWAVTPGNSVWLWAKSNLPGITLGVSHVDRGRLSGAWGVFAATMFVSGLVVMSVAGMLVLSAAAAVPEYAETHRRVAASVLTAVTLLATICLWRLGVALVPAVLWAALSALIPAAILEWDRRKTAAGTLVIPVSLAWCLGFVVPLTMIGRGEWWVWQDRFLASNIPTATTWGVTVLVVTLAVTAWRAAGGYAVALSSRGRVAAIASNRGEAWRNLSLKSSSENFFPELWGSAPVRAGQAIRSGRLSNCATAASRRRLLAEGMMAVPIGRVIVHGTLLVVLTPIVMRLTVPAFRENPQALAAAIAAIALTAVWLSPLIGWNERASRVAAEIGCLLPRPLYVAAIRGLLVRQMIAPMATLFLAIGGVMIYRGSSWWLFGPLAGVTFASAVITISTVELMLTVRSAVLKFFIMIAIAYPAFGAGAVSIAVLYNPNSATLGQPWLRPIPFVILGGMAAVMRFWMNYRLPRFEFGRLA